MSQPDVFNCYILKADILIISPWEKIFRESSPLNIKKDAVIKCVDIANNHIPDADFAKRLLVSQQHPVGTSVLFYPKQNQHLLQMNLK